MDRLLWSGCYCVATDMILNVVSSKNDLIDHLRFSFMYAVDYNLMSIGRG